MGTKTKNIQQLLRSANAAYNEELTQAGHALQKHMNRPGSAFPQISGNPGVLNRVGGEIVEEILTNPGSVWSTLPSGRFGTVIDIISPSGRGVQYDAIGKFIGFLEP